MLTVAVHQAASVAQPAVGHLIVVSGFNEQIDIIKNRGLFREK